MQQQILLDTGPLVAFINPRDQLNQWASDQWGKVNSPLLTCEAVITEACFLLRNVYRGEDAIAKLVESKIVQIPFHLDDEISSIRQLLMRYQSVPMSLADACLVRMAELYSGSVVLTLDRDFTIYRKNTNQIINLMTPIP